MVIILLIDVACLFWKIKLLLNQKKKFSELMRQWDNSSLGFLNNWIKNECNKYSELMEEWITNEKYHCSITSFSSTVECWIENRSSLIKRIIYLRKKKLRTIEEKFVHCETVCFLDN
jgi:hypothetical protein